MTDQLTLPGPLVSHGTTERVLHFVRPVIGFPLSSSYSLHSLGEAYAPFVALTSLDEEGLTFVAVAPGLLFADYVLEIPEPDVALLGLTSADDADVLGLVTRRKGLSPTVNLLGPVVVDRRTGSALQVVLQDSAYRVDVPVDGETALAGNAPVASSWRRGA
ncbi:MAG: flagellar assembly protein FliW [Acidimicrobiales bacterium]